MYRRKHKMITLAAYRLYSIKLLFFSRVHKKRAMIFHGSFFM